MSKATTRKADKQVQPTRLVTIKRTPAVVTIIVNGKPHEISEADANSLHEDLGEALGRNAGATPDGIDALRKIYERERDRGAPAYPRRPVQPMPPIWYASPKFPDGVVTCAVLP